MNTITKSNFKVAIPVILSGLLILAEVFFAFFTLFENKTFNKDTLIVPINNFIYVFIATILIIDGINISKSRISQKVLIHFQWLFLLLFICGNIYNIFVCINMAKENKLTILSFFESVVFFAFFVYPVFYAFYHYKKHSTKDLFLATFIIQSILIVIFFTTGIVLVFYT